MIRLTAPQYFIATKLEAFQTRGNSDARVSYDMEDIIAVLDGRSGIADEITASESAVRSVIAGAFQRLSQLGWVNRFLKATCNLAIVHRSPLHKLQRFSCRNTVRYEY